MRLPKRVPEHVKENASFKLLQQCTPDMWIIREARTEDYGIDCYLELVPDSGYLVGHLASVQLKSTDTILWSQSKTHPEYRIASSPSIKTSTVNYWMGLQIPVFLCVAELTQGRMFWSNVKSHVRRNYRDLQTQETMTFRLSTARELCKAEMKELPFVYSYLLERNHVAFDHSVIDLLVHASDYRSFMDDHGWQDPFLEVEAQETIKLTHLCKAVRTVLEQTEASRVDPVPLSEWFKRDSEQWGTRLGDLHEATISRIIEELKPNFERAIRQAANAIANTEDFYWQSRNHALYEMCINLEYAG